MDLSNLKPAEGSTQKVKRIGRGQGSGRGNTSGRGNKGQKSESGATIPAWFEGGQMPLQRRLPKFGFKNRFRVEYRPVNVGRLQLLVDEGRIEAGSTITPDVLIGFGLVSKNDLVKILGSGDLAASLKVSAHAFSASARTKIEQAGGSASDIA